MVWREAKGFIGSPPELHGSLMRGLGSGGRGGGDSGWGGGDSEGGEGESGTGGDEKGAFRGGQLGHFGVAGLGGG